MSCRKESKILGLRNPGIAEYFHLSTKNTKRRQSATQDMWIARVSVDIELKNHVWHFLI